MRNRKVYGASQENLCPFCGKQSTSQSEQGIPVCKDHKEEAVNWKCICGEWLDLKIGKFGPYFNCFKCGNLSFSRAKEINSNVPGDYGVKKQVKAKKTYKTESESKKETVIRSDELDFYF